MMSLKCIKYVNNMLVDINITTNCQIVYQKGFFPRLRFKHLQKVHQHGSKNREMGKDIFDNCNRHFLG